MCVGRGRHILTPEDQLELFSSGGKSISSQLPVSAPSDIKLVAQQIVVATICFWCFFFTGLVVKHLPVHMGHMRIAHESLPQNINANYLPVPYLVYQISRLGKQVGARHWYLEKKSLLPSPP